MGFVLSHWGESPSYESQIPGAPYQRGCFPGPYFWWGGCTQLSEALEGGEEMMSGGAAGDQCPSGTSREPADLPARAVGGALARTQCFQACRASFSLQGFRSIFTPPGQGACTRECPGYIACSALPVPSPTLSPFSLFSPFLIQTDTFLG